jgi:hypothetical protein
MDIMVVISTRMQLIPKNGLKKLLTAMNSFRVVSTKIQTNYHTQPPQFMVKQSLASLV